MADNNLSQAILAIQSGDMKSARVALSAILHQDPKNVNAWRWMAVALDDPDKKRQCWQRILKLKPNDGQALQALATLYADEPSAPMPPPQQQPSPQQPLPQLQRAIEGEKAATAEEQVY